MKKSGGWLIAVWGFVGVVLQTWSCGDQALRRPCGDRALSSPLSPRLVLLYATCSLNKDFLSPYNSAVTFTPHLEEFSRKAVVFRRHQTESGQSGTAFASIFSGTQADHHGVFHHPTALNANLELIGESFRRQGYEVVTWLKHSMASGQLNYAQGADDDDVYDTRLAANDRRLLRILGRVKRDECYKALLITNFTVTHGPYNLSPVEAFCNRHPDHCRARSDPEAFLRTVEFYHQNHLLLSYDFPGSAERWNLTGQQLDRLVAATELLYRANVARLDQLFGQLLKKIRQSGLFEDSVIVFTADHGETLFREGTHFKWTHGHQLAPEVLNVPLMIHARGIGPGETYDAVTRSIDLFPTLAGLAGLLAPRLPPENSGFDLSRCLQGLEPPPELRAYSHTNLIPKPVIDRSRPWRLFRALYPRIAPELMWTQVRDGDRVYQLRRKPTGEWAPAVFDLAADPWELTDLFDPEDGQQRHALRDVKRYRERLIRSYRSLRKDSEEIDLEHQEELLRSLGYIE